MLELEARPGPEGNRPGTAGTALPPLLCPPLVLARADTGADADIGAGTGATTISSDERLPPLLSLGGGSVALILKRSTSC